MHSCSAYAAMERGAPLTPLTIQRRAPLEGDVVVRILYCGVCHSDVFAVRKGRGGGQYPLVPGHEIVGEVVAVGSGVARFAPGDTVVVGTIIDSCRHCEPCIGREEQYCYEGVTSTYNGRDRHDGTVTKGGYASEIVVDERFVYHAPQGLDLPRVAPLLCAGATTFSPAAQLECRAGQDGGHHRARRARPHRAQARPRDGCACCPVHHFARQGRGRDRDGGARRGAVARSGSNGGASFGGSISSSTPLRAAIR